LENNQGLGDVKKSLFYLKEEIIMSKIAKRLAVGTMCATMVLGSTMGVFAEDVDTTTLPEGSQEMVNGTGTLEGYVTLDVTKLVLPTTAVTSEFTLDPQGLLHVGNSSQFNTDSGAVYFENTGNTFSDTSDAITIKNKSSYAIDVTVAVSLQNSEGSALSQIKLVDKDSLATATDPSLYFGIIKNDSDTVAITTDGQTITASAKEVPLVNNDGATAGYQLVATQTDPNNGLSASKNGYYYYYDLTSGYAPGTDQTITFKMTGATNDVEGWKDVTESVAAKLTYTVKKHVDSYFGDVTSVSASNNVVTATLPEGVTIKTVVITKVDGSQVDWTANGNATVSGAKITFVTGAITPNVGGTLTVTYSDGHTDVLTIQ
jgi:hypothetical protein